MVEQRLHMCTTCNLQTLAVLGQDIITRRVFPIILHVATTLSVGWDLSTGQTIQASYKTDPDDQL